MTERMEKITVTLPKEAVATLRQRAKQGTIPSVSGYIADSVRSSLNREAWLARWRKVTPTTGTNEARQWANDLIDGHWGPVGHDQDQATP